MFRGNETEIGDNKSFLYMNQGSGKYMPQNQTKPDIGVSTQQKDKLVRQILQQKKEQQEMFEVRDVLNKVELESDRKSNYYREELRKMKKKGHRTGKPPFGMKAKKIGGIRKFVEDKKEQKIISRIMVLHKNSVNYKMISEIMKQEGLVVDNRMLENPTFIKRIISKQKQIITSVNKCLEGMKL